jgi:hypothetical protein
MLAREFRQAEGFADPRSSPQPLDLLARKFWQSYEATDIVSAVQQALILAEDIHQSPQLAGTEPVE